MYYRSTPHPTGIAVLLALSASAFANEVTLPPVTISANGSPTEQSATGRVKGYVAKSSATAGRIAADQVEIAQSLSIVGQDEMKARGVVTSEEAIRYTPGVNVAPWGYDERGTTLFTLRGFSNPAGAYLDGLHQFAGGFGTHIFETYGMERIEVLRGAASVMVGDSEVSGIVNHVSKRPRREMINEVGVGLGDAAQKELRTDLGGEVAGERNVQYRLTARAAENGSRADFHGADAKDSRHYYVAPTISWQPIAGLNLTLLASLRDNKGPAHNLEYIHADQSRSRVLVTDPHFSQFNHQQSRLALETTYQFADGWHYRQQLATAKVDARTDAAWLLAGQGSADPDGNVSRYASRYQDGLRNRNWVHQIEGRFQTGGVQHALAAGIDWHRYLGDNRTSYGAAPDINIRNPVYRPIDQDSLVLSRAGTERVSQTGWFVQDRLQIGAWGADLALRHDKVRKQTHVTTSMSAPDDTHTSQRNQATTGRLGINHRLDNGLVPYLNYGTSFQTQVGQDREGRHFQPAKGKQIEGGVKYQTSDGQSLLTAAVFDQTKENVLTPDPVDQNFSVQTGEVRVKGIELEARYALTKELNLLASYSHIDTKVSRSNGQNLGKQLTLSPKEMASLWLDYSLPQGWGVGIGGRYKGKDFADEGNTLVNPARTLVDAAVWYKHGPWHARLNVSNLGDQDYITNLGWGSPAQGRKINLNVDYKF
ncbi:iron complex outermembrane receptor protein [Chitinivorax tropicus]|uniref:Iron complex outermembrane receptor protein n=1 Tax=Chitinivorax tropicus TaxID=714531 RepID=A0A840MQH4_9PROT|nr:TonB-dependent siderophore receptor [Chitinivorax tropicus]MBB5018423.1 iron complex outermembrane receptor protein [Chitinivorax tropicus]